MKLLFENWRQYLNEQEEAFPYQIYCDMDGVLVDLVGGVLDYSKNDPSNKSLRKEVENILKLGWGWTEKHPELQEGLDYINNIVSNDVEFWATLPPMPDKDMLWGYIAQYNPIVLSHPWDDASEEGKREWVAAELSPPPTDEKYTGDKYMFAVNEDGSPNLLIDDFEKYIGPWQAAGGIAILHTSAESTIKKLIDLQENI